MGDRIRLAIFDMDGTLTRERNSWDTFFHHYHHDADGSYDQLFSGRMSEKEWAETNLMKVLETKPDLTVSEVREVLLEESHLRSGVRECVSELRGLGIECMIVSNGLDPLAGWIAADAGFSDRRANWFETDHRGNLMPHFVGKVNYKRKADWLHHWVRELHIDMKDTVSVGDGENDIGLFLESGHSIAFNPINERVASSGEAVIEGDDLRKCSELIREWSIGR